MNVDMHCFWFNSNYYSARLQEKYQSTTLRASSLQYCMTVGRNLPRVPMDAAKKCAKAHHRSCKMWFQFGAGKWKRVD